MQYGRYTDVMRDTDVYGGYRRTYEYSEIGGVSMVRVKYHRGNLSWNEVLEYADFLALLDNANYVIDRVTIL